MRRTTCQDCVREFQLSETYKMEDKIYCKNCLERVLANRKVIKKENAIVRQTDPTVCFNCGFDNNQTELSQVAGLPVCSKCGDFFRNRPFPVWIKASFIVIVGLVVFSFVFNFRFIKSYYFIKQASRAFQKGDLEKTINLAKSASNLVPEDVYLNLEVFYFEGLYYLEQEKWLDAVDAFNKCNGLSQEYYNYEDGILSAKIGLSFDNKDYDSFLRYALELQTKYPEDSIFNGQVASAYACKYAVTGDNQYKEKTLENLKKSKELSGNNPAYKEYEQRISYRLSTREIIDKKEFDKKFPNGWKEPGKE